MAYSLVREILRAAKALRTVPCRVRETDRTYKDPRGMGQKSEPEHSTQKAVTEERRGDSGKKVGVEWGPGD